MLISVHRPCLRMNEQKSGDVRDRKRCADAAGVVLHYVPLPRKAAPRRENVRLKMCKCSDNKCVSGQMTINDDNYRTPTAPCCTTFDSNPRLSVWSLHVLPRDRLQHPRNTECRISGDTNRWMDKYQSISLLPWYRCTVRFWYRYILRTCVWSNVIIKIWDQHS